MADVKDVAKYFILLADENDEGISNLKLQKLVYYAQGFYLALNEETLFDADIEAWAHGPVVPELYHDYKDFGREAIDSDPRFNPHTRLMKGEIEHIEEIFDVFGQFSAWKLRNMTHEESPWIENEGHAGVISKRDLKAYFDTRVE
ncbi:SocA family protein [Vibrio parahaemolyticus]|uniref:Panacea domain-containing protein n=1 Tax=unclassified Vibrio TaxID=2614977 RepID=UPI001D840DE9|nr:MULTISPECIES: type II toxin-antitoxin system antitoxin SocA domain-containing protein [unclassified Vibrio]EGQ8953008.1 DUF4065 domain-containing protein [Vibrio parahaemolyticus]EGQ8987401.1 DUF4065 domain-containing protein [Vibrio parahaemolyticus]EGQ9006597.1 DUF4065 domain-containing protein [Vibrio parahaemolyticus]EGR2870551.1 DUF4065 domain-containing protein [Vibrio parahaemolyticus]EGR2895625.1 DUF4065 domain-containing protein [Vibrio parahaemolyticus]